MLAANREEQEAEQKRSLGRMVLQHFEAWASMTGLTADEMLKMQTDIAQKYGLIDSTAAEHLRSMESNWSNTLAVMRGDSESFFGAFLAGFNSLPSEKIIRIRYELSGRPEDIPKNGGGGDRGGGGTTPPAQPDQTPDVTPVKKPTSQPKKPAGRGEVETAALLALGGVDVLPGFPAPGGTPSIQPGIGGFPAPGMPIPGPGPGSEPTPGPFLPPYIQPGPGQFLPPNVQPGIQFPSGPQLISRWPTPGGTPGENPGVWRGGTPSPQPGGGGGAGKQFAGCSITINVFTNDPEMIVRELERYMRLRGASSPSMVGH